MNDLVIDTRTINFNQIWQNHITSGGRIELVVQRDGRLVMDLLPANEPIHVPLAEAA